MIFTTITNGEGDAMRQLERKDAGTPAKTAAKGAAKASDKTPARKRSEAQLVLANGEMGESARLGLSLVGAGVTALTIGVLEGLARKGEKAKWWGKLSPTKRGLILMAFAVVAGLIARHRRKEGHHKSACALEAAAIGAWTVATIYFTESGMADSVSGLNLNEHGVGAVGVDELKALDSKIDDDIRDAARRLRELAEEERAAAGREERREADDDEMGLLAYHGDAGMDEDDEDIF